MSVVIATPQFSERDVLRENYETPTKNMVKLLYDFADHFINTYVIDLFEYGEEYDAEFDTKYSLNGHINPMSYLYTAQIIDSYIDYIIRHNPQEFKYAGLINSGIEFNK